ncbi:MAG: hypothetical protein JWQ50_712 [Caballeronia mineralivorans]|nr:hypothetical protein [Caballeronia mineralivorans]
MPFITQSDSSASSGVVRNCRVGPKTSRRGCALCLKTRTEGGWRDEFSNLTLLLVGCVQIGYIDAYSALQAMRGFQNLASAFTDNDAGEIGVAGRYARSD